MVDNSNTQAKVNRQSVDDSRDSRAATSAQVQNQNNNKPIDERDPLTFLQSISQRLKSLKTDQPNTANSLSDDVDEYIRRLGDNRVRDYKTVHREGDKERVHKA